ncbi:DNA/RNA non-specific endonuclease [Flavobacterium aquiphilum]|uniref:DNA/RNA non-specific endonuclease n=1 Tax=Flavobacterium aquiphilum TaxID=3003261 RepID=UPI00248065B6|nr:DNA/RNA non-specific endonuclease [Flavobacterium aquiphilum]
MGKTGPVFKALTKKPQRKTIPFFPSAIKKKKKENALVPVTVKAKKIETADPVLNFKKASILDIQKAKIVKTAKSQKKHGTAEEKKEEMQKAVSINPALEKSSVAKKNQVEEMANAKKTVKKFDSKKFSDAILENIKKVIPKNKEEMEKDQTSSEKMSKAQQDITDSLEKEKQNTNGELANTVSATPDQASVVSKTVTPLSKEDIGTYPNVSNPGFAPPLKTAQDNDLSADSKKIDNELANNDISEEQLQNGNEPSFDHSLVEKKESQKQAADTHQQYLKLANPIAGATKTSTNSLTLGGLAKMFGVRNKQLSQVDKNKELKKQKEEEVRTKVATDLNKIYDDTKLLVETNLKNLTEKVNKDFDEALDIANKTFEKNVKERTDTSWFDDLVNWAKGIPKDIKKVFIEEQDNFINSLAPVVRKIGDLVERELNQATKDIDDGKLKTQNYWKNQDKDTQRIAGDVFTHATERFSELEAKVEEANEGLKQSITTKFNAAVAKLEETFDRIQEENKSWLERAYDAVVGVIKAIIQMKNLLLNVLAKVADVVGKIILDPIGFLSNLLDAIVLGFQNFGKNALEHLKKGFFEWLMGNMPPSIKFPKQWDLTGIFEFIMSVFGLTWENIKARATKLYGATVVAALETGFEIFQIIRKEGIGGLWNYIKEKIGDLKVMVVDAIQNMLIETVIKAGITWVISLFNPVGAFIKACKLIYDVISWFINNAKRILDLINSIIDSTALIVAGKITQAANFVENSLAKLVPIAIGFLAGLLGLGDLSKKVQALLDKIQAPVNKAIDWVLEKAGTVVKKLFKAGKAGVKKLLSWVGLKKEFKAEDDKKHSINIEGNEKKPKLIIRSTPKTLEELIIDFKKEQKYKNNKSKYDARIESALRIKTKFENAMEKNQGKTGVDYDGQFEEMTQSLINYIKDLFISSKAADKRNVTFSGESNGVANGMIANPLINDGTAGASTTGATGIYDTLFKRKHHGGNVPYYIQGHLLNHNLGGPNEKQNLTPLKRSTNSEHEAIVEKSLKKHYLEKKKLKYNVTPTYGLSSPLITSPTTPDQKKINEIKIQESKSVPVSISIQSSYFIDEGGTEKEKSLFNGTIRNNIETNEKDYTL